MFFLRLLCVFAFCGLVAGCSIHPIPEDVTRLSAHDIVRKIRCEAKEITEALYSERRLYELQPALDESDQELKTLTKTLGEINAKTIELKRKQDELARKRVENSAAYRIIINKIDEVIRQQTDKENFSSDTANRIERLKEEIEQLNNERESLNREKQNLERDDRANIRRKVMTEVLIEQETARRKKLKKIIEFNSTVVGYNFAFEITENADATAGGTFVWPIHLGSITLGVGLGDKKQRFSDRTIKLSTTFGDLIKMDDCIADEGRGSFRYPIAGRIGLDEVIKQYVLINEDKYSKLSATKKDIYTDTIRFTTEINGSLNPSFSIAPALGRTISADLTLSADRKDIHEVVVSIIPYKAKTPTKPTPVQIVNIGEFPKTSGK